MAALQKAARLLEIGVTGYRSCRSIAFRPHPELSALIGINGAGKTNLLSSIRLLSRGSAGMWRSRRSESKSDNDTTLTAWFDVDDGPVGLRLKIRLSESNRNTDEVVALDEAWNFKAVTGDSTWINFPMPLLLKDDGPGASAFAHEIVYANQLRHTVFMGMQETVKRSEDAAKLQALAGDRRVSTAVLAIEKFREGIAYYGASQFTDPTRCPSSFEVDEDSRLADNHGAASRAHVKFLFDLYSLRKTRPVLYDEYARFVARGGLGLLSRITWKEIKLSSNTADVKSGGTIKTIRKTKTLVIPRIQIGSAYITLNQLSEGTFKTLALVFYVMTDASRCLLIEEPEVCVHQGLLTRIIDTIKAYSHFKQVIFSTHSDLLVDSLSPSNIFVVEMLKTGTKVSELERWVGQKGRAALHTYLAETGTLGEYWRSGGLS